MTNTYDTSNEQLGSTAVKVLYNNASNLDDAVNSDANTWVDRPPFGRVRRTWRGMENAFDQFLAGTAFELPPLVYVDGTPLQVDRPTQLIQRAGVLYSVKLPSSFPVTLSGTWATDEPLLTVRSDQSLRQDLADGTTALVSPTVVGVGDAPYDWWGSHVGYLSALLGGRNVSLVEKRFIDLITSKPDPDKPSTWNWAPAIQAAIDELTTTNPDTGTRGGMLDVPSGLFKHGTTTIVMKPFVSIRGGGFGYNNAQGTVFQYDGVNDAWQFNNPINSSQPIHSVLQDFTIYAPNLGTGKGAFADTCSTFLHMARIGLKYGASGVGLILDQTEISVFDHMAIEAQGTGTGASIWFVNGDDRTPGALGGFTNRNTIRDSGLNPHGSGSRGIIFDGGNYNRIIGTNFNGGTTQLAVSGANTLDIQGCGFEGATVRVLDVTRGSRDLPSPRINFSNNFVKTPTGVVAISIPADTVESFGYDGNEFETDAGGTPDLIDQHRLVHASGNTQIGFGPKPFNNYGISSTDGSVTCSLIGLSTAGSNAPASASLRFDRAGRACFVNLDYTVATLSGSAGQAAIQGLPYLAGSGFAAFSVGAYSGVTLSAGYTELSAMAQPGTNWIALYQSGPGVTLAMVTMAQISAGFSITLAGTYLIQV